MELNHVLSYINIVLDFNISFKITIVKLLKKWDLLESRDIELNGLSGEK
jgi:hypothetical protein